MTTGTGEAALEVLENYRAKIVDIRRPDDKAARSSTACVRLRLSETRILNALASALGVTVSDLLRPRVEYLLREAERLAEFAETVGAALEEGGDDG